jgi:hypothetical protein
MVDIAALAQQAMTIIAPLLPLAASHAATQVADGFLRQPGAKLYEWLASKLKETSAADAIDRAAAEPENQRWQMALQLKIEEMARNDSEFRRHLVGLLEEMAGVSGNVTATQTAAQTGDNNKSAQAAGNSINIQIG